MTPSAVRMVLMEGENADGVTVDQDGFDVEAGGAVSDRVVSAILGTRESAQEGGYRLASTGVVVGDQAQAGLLRDALAGRKVRDVTLVSAFLAAAALAQATGAAIGYARTALMFVQPDSATLALVDSADGAVSEVHRVLLPADDAAAMAELVELTAGAAGLVPGPDGVFVVGSGVNVGMLKPTLQAATRLAVSAPEEPDLALARGAALASAHPPLLESSTSAVAWARDPGTGVAALGSAHVSAVPADYDATAAEPPLAYSAVSESELPDSAATDTKRRRSPFLLAGSALAALVVGGAATLVIAMAVGIRPMADYQPVPVPHVVVPAQQEPAPAPEPQAAPAPPPSALPAPPADPPALLPEVQPAPPAPAPTQAPVPAARQVPAPAPAAPPAAPAPAAPPPAPVPEAPAPVPAAPAPVPVPVAPAPIPIPFPLPILLPAPAPWPAAPKPPAAPKAPTAPKAPELPPIFSPPTQSPPKADWPGNDGGQRGGGLFPGWPGNGGGQRGGGLFPWPAPGDKAGGGHGGGFPGLGGGGAHGGHGGFGF